MRGVQRGLVATALLVAGCGDTPAGDGDAGSGASEDGDGGSAGSSGADGVDGSDGTGGETCPDMTPCEDGGLCLGGECQPVPACEGAACERGPRGPLPDTNLRQCYGASPDGTDGTIACPDEAGSPTCGETDYCGGDAQYGWDAEHGAAERWQVVAGEEGIVVDLVTGYEWQLCVSGQTGAGCAGAGERVDWFTAMAYCEDSIWGGMDDWVLPDSYALQSIYDYGTTSPAMDTSVWVNAPSGFADDMEQWWIECVWSSSDWAIDDTVAWALMENNGDVSSGSGIEYHSHDKGAEGWEGCYVRCVRELPARTQQRFLRVEAAADEWIVGDTATGLVWQGCSLGQSGADCAGPAEMIDWRSALATCEQLDWGGRDDWRLPNIKELRSIVEQTSQLPAVDAAAFPNTPFYGKDGDTTMNVGQYWSSTGRSYNSFALYVDLGFGFSHFYEQPEGRHVICVRG